MFHRSIRVKMAAFRMAPASQVAVIVNDMAAVNVDAALLRGGGALRQTEARLVELSNGCICCSLRADLIEVLNFAGFN